MMNATKNQENGSSRGCAIASVVFGLLTTGFAIASLVTPMMVFSEIGPEHLFSLGAHIIKRKCFALQDNGFYTLKVSYLSLVTGDYSKLIKEYVPANISDPIDDHIKISAGLAITAAILAGIATLGALFACCAPHLKCGKVLSITGFLLALISSVASFSVFVANDKQASLNVLDFESTSSYGAGLYLLISASLTSFIGVILAATIKGSAGAEQSRMPVKEETLV